MTEEYLLLEKLEVYKLSRKLSTVGWNVYHGLNWEGKKGGGNQFIDAVDSVGANVSEGYGRFHYLDKSKFYYNVRGSLLESKHWLKLLNERGKVKEAGKLDFLEIYSSLRPGLNGLINSARKSRDGKA